METHICNKDIVLLTYPPQYKCSVCGKVDSTDFTRTVGETNWTQAPTKTDKQGESISKSDLYGHSVTTPDKQTLN